MPQVSETVRARSEPTMLDRTEQSPIPGWLVDTNTHGRIHEDCNLLFDLALFFFCSFTKVQFSSSRIKMSAISASEKVDGFTRKSMRKAQKQRKSQGSSQFRTQSALVELSPLPQLKGTVPRMTSACKYQCVRPLSGFAMSNTHTHTPYIMSFL